MSVRMIVAALNAKVGSSGRKLVLLKLADNANDDGLCWPSFQYLADHCEMGRSTVKTHIKQLEDDGFLVVESRSNGRSSNRYRLTIENGKIADKITQSPEPNRSDLNRSDLNRSESNRSDFDSNRSESDPLNRSDSDPRTCHFFEPVNNPTTPLPREPSFPMFVDWQPGDQFAALCQRSRINPTDPATLDSLNNFVSHHSAHPGRVLRASQWDAKAIAWINQDRQRRVAAEQKQAEQQATGTHDATPAQRRAALTESILDVNNTDW